MRAHAERSWLLLIRAVHAGSAGAVPASRLERPAVRALVRLLAEDGTVRAALSALGFEISEPSEN